MAGALSRSARLPGGMREGGLIPVSDGALGFGVLGPLQVNGEDVAVPGKQRVVLAALLMRANRVVPVETLIDALWDGAPPASARVTVQGYVRRLRRDLPGGAGERIITRDPGYLIRVANGELDLDLFTGLCGRARSAAAGGDWLGVTGQLGRALSLWRGDPLADVPSDVLRRDEVPRLAELRWQALELRFDAELRLGHHAGLVAELRQLTASEPVREGLHGLLMVALYRSGRQAEALEVYRDIDRALREEIGIAPGPGLRELHRRILAADPDLADVRTAVAPGQPADEPATITAPAAGSPDPAGAAGQAAAVPVPAQLPPDIADFTGRDEQVKLLSDPLTSERGDRSGAVVISAVAGMGGIGKTALAVHVGHRLREWSPDGQLYAALQGTASPRRPVQVLGEFLRSLGDLDPAIPDGEAERAARYRSLLADRRVLVVLDDARDAAQVRPLLPGGAGCAVIVTSRAALPDLAGAVQLRHTDSEQDRLTAVGRLLRWYGEQAVRAARALFPRLPASDLFPAGLVAMADPVQAIDWYGTELDALRAAVGHAAELGLHDVVAQIAAAMWAFFERSPYRDDWLTFTEAGVASGRALGDDAALSWLLNSLGQVHAWQDRFAAARACLTEALEIRRRTGDRTGQAVVLNSLGTLDFRQGRFSAALDYMRSALVIHREVSAPRHVAVCLHNIGETLLYLQRYDEALDHMARALAIRQEVGDKHGECRTENTIADTYLALDRYEDSLEHYQRSWAALQSIARDGPDHASALYGMGAALAGLDRDGEARDAWQAAIPILDRLGDPRAAELRGRLAGSSGTGEAALVIPQPPA